MQRLTEERDALAQVRADGMTTRYRRAGTGSPVLLLCDAADHRFVPLMERLAASRCVIAPARAEVDGDGGWLRVERLVAFLDGLGIAAAPVIGVGGAAGPAAALARLHPDRVDRLVLLGESDGDASADAGAAVAALERESD